MGKQRRLFATFPFQLKKAGSRLPRVKNAIKTPVDLVESSKICTFEPRMKRTKCGTHPSVDILRAVPQWLQFGYICKRQFVNVLILRLYEIGSEPSLSATALQTQV